MKMMCPTRLIPWRRVAHWRCLACGECCRWFEIPLRADEYARIIRLYGLDIVRLGIGRSYLKKTIGSLCIFQRFSSGRWLCGLQRDKPLVCKLWPFSILRSPKHGRNEEASYHHNEDEYYVYVHPYCRGLIFGEPTDYLANKVIPEAVKISLHLERIQNYTTADLTEITLRVNAPPVS